jgi:hypothetical protein
MAVPGKNRISGGPLTRRVRTGLALVAAGAVFAATACSVHEPMGPDPVLTTIAVAPDATLAVNETHQFTAVGSDAEGDPFVIDPVWDVVDGGGTIDQDGMFTAGTLTGTYAATVTATSGVIFGTANVIVTAGPVISIIVTPDPVTLAPDDTRQYTAVAEDDEGNVYVISPVWDVVAGGGAIDAGGLFTAGLVLGTYDNTVSATSGGITGFATVTVSGTPPGAPLVDLGDAAPNGIMAGTEVTCISGGIIYADVSISPGNTVTGFGPCEITGVQHLADAVADQGQIDLTSAYDDLAGLPCDPANAIVADLGGTTLAAGVYCTASGIAVTGALTLDGGGDPDATFVFQAGTSLTTAGDVVLINGAQARNVYWQVGSSATLGTASKWQGNVLTLTSITLVDNATLTGRALARNGAVSLGTNNVIVLP